MKKRATLQDIANRLQVNISTVSRALNDFPNINEKTRNKVLRTARKLNYCPNYIAKGLVGKNTRVFSLITPHLNPHVLPVIRGVADGCRKLDYALMLFPFDYWTDETIAFSEIKEKWMIDGILIYNIIYHKDIEENIKELKSKKIPFVFINKYLHSRQVNNVSFDNDDAVQQIIDHLYTRGHRRIGIINGCLQSNDGVERYQAFKACLKKHNLKFNRKYVGRGDYGEDIAYRAMKKILNVTPLPTAMVCASDLMAIAATRAIRNSGLTVPGDIAVTGIDDIALGRYLEPNLTTVRIPLEDIGRQAVELLKQRITLPEQPVTEIPVKGKLIVRESTQRA